MKNLNPPGKSEVIPNPKFTVMNYVSKYNSNKATVCADRNCITVYGEVAKLINSLAILVALIVAIAYVAKALR